jgi:hypothetical protein
LNDLNVRQTRIIDHGLQRRFGRGGRLSSNVDGTSIGNLVGDLLQAYLFVGPAYLTIAAIVIIVVHCSNGFLVGIHGKASWESR